MHNFLRSHCVRLYIVVCVLSGFGWYTDFFAGHGPSSPDENPDQERMVTVSSSSKKPAVPQKAASVGTLLPVKEAGKEAKRSHSAPSSARSSSKKVEKSKGFGQKCLIKKLNFDTVSSAEDDCMRTRLLSPRAKTNIFFSGEERIRDLCQQRIVVAIAPHETPSQRPDFFPHTETLSQACSCKQLKVLIRHCTQENFFQLVEQKTSCTGDVSSTIKDVLSSKKLFSTAKEPKTVSVLVQNFVLEVIRTLECSCVENLLLQEEDFIEIVDQLITSIFCKWIEMNQK